MKQSAFPSHIIAKLCFKVSDAPKVIGPGRIEDVESHCVQWRAADFHPTIQRVCLSSDAVYGPGEPVAPH